MIPLTPVAQKFILHWGEMGTRWGINRTVAQINALLFISVRSLNAEEIATTLEVARSNVSTSLKELMSWNIVRIVHQAGDRRDYFEARKDVWDTFRRVLDERKRREIDPTVTLLRDCVAEAHRAGAVESYAADRLGELLGFFETTSGWYEQVRKLPNETVLRFMQLGAEMTELLNLQENKEG